MALKIKGTEVITDEKHVYVDKAEIADSLETNTLYIGNTDVSNNGYFHSDTAGRTAFNGGKFYIKNGVSHYYNYAPSQYHGDQTGSTHYFRGNALTGDDWSINTSGMTAASIDVSGNSDGYQVQGTTVIDSSRNLTQLGNGSATLSLTGNTLKLTIGGTDQDTQDLPNPQSTTITATAQYNNNSNGNWMKQEDVACPAGYSLSFWALTSRSTSGGFNDTDLGDLGGDYGTSCSNVNGVLRAITMLTSQNMPVGAFLSTTCTGLCTEDI